MENEYPLPEDSLDGELVYIHGIHNPEPYSWGWGLLVNGPSDIPTDEDGQVKVWKVLFRGKLVQLRFEEFTRFAWYNKHLFHENYTKMVP